MQENNAHGFQCTCQKNMSGTVFIITPWL